MKLKFYKYMLGLAVATAMFTACSDDVDESDRYTFVGETAADYFANNPQYSQYSELINKAVINKALKVSSDRSQSTIAQMLSSYGYYMVFAPTNDAIERYLKTVAEKGVIPQGVRTLAEITNKHVADSLADVIVYNSVIDVSENKTFSYIYDYAATGNQTDKVMQYANMNNRFLHVSSAKMSSPTDENYDPEFGSRTYYNIEYNSRTLQTDIKCYNGIVHAMYDVVAPSDERINQVLASNPDLTIFAQLVSKCGLDDTLSMYMDEDYHNLYWSNPANIQNSPKNFVHHGNEAPRRYLEERYYGYTIFPETNKTFEEIVGIADASDASIDKLRDYLQNVAYQANEMHDEKGNAIAISWGNDYKKENNWLNFFITYHILPMNIEYKYLVIHYNETGYSWKDKESTPDRSVNVTEHYRTMGAPRMLFVTEGCTTAGKRLNYFAKMNRDDPKVADQVYDAGIKVEDPGASIVNPINGRIYPIAGRMLVYSAETAERQGSQRMRMDVCSLIPELITMGIRRTEQGGYYGIPRTNDYNYFHNLTSDQTSEVYYLPAYNKGYNNYQGDEINITGLYTITLTLPPVPKTDTYELRIGVSASPLRGMMQVYYGLDDDDMQAAGIPLDMRVGGNWNHASNSQSNVGWEQDGTSPQLNDDRDRRMRLQGFMKAPASITKNPTTIGLDDVKTMAQNSLRDVATSGYSRTDPNNGGVAGGGDIVRRIILTAPMRAGEVYQIRFKNVLDISSSEFFLDYLELVPKSVYDNPVSPEDIW